MSRMGLSQATTLRLVSPPRSQKAKEGEQVQMDEQVDIVPSDDSVSAASDRYAEEDLHDLDTETEWGISDRI